MSGKSVRGVVGQTVVEQHRVVTFYQDRDSLIEKAGLSRFARVDSQPPTSGVFKGGGAFGDAPLPLAGE